MEKLENVLKNIVMIIFGLMVLGLFVMSCVETVYFDAPGSFWRMGDSLLRNVIIIICVLLLGGMLYRLVNRHNKDWKVGNALMFIVTGMHIIIMLAFVLLTQYEPVSDELYCMNVAADLLNKDATAWQQANYMFIYPFQGGIVLAMYLVSLVVGPNNYVAMQLLNVVFYATALWVMYRILLLMRVSQRLCRIIYIISPLWFPLMLYVSFVYGNIVGLMLALFAIMFLYRYFDTKKIINIVLVALCIGLSCVLKSNYQITLIAMCCVCVLEAIHKKKWQPTVCIVAMVVGYLLIKTVTFAVIENMTGTPTPDGIPMSAWAAMGVYDSEDYGWFNNYNGFTFYKNGYDYDATNKECIGFFLQRMKLYVKSPAHGAKFFWIKTASQWAEPTFQGFNILTTRDTNLVLKPWVKTIIYEGGLNGLLRGFLDVAQTLVYFGALAFAWTRRKAVTPKEMVFAIAFIGGFIFHMFWEAKGQYTIIYFFMIIPYAAIGWKNMCARVDGLINDKGQYFKKT